MQTKITFFLGLLITCQIWASDKHIKNSPFLNVYNAQKKVSLKRGSSLPNFRQAYYAKQDMLPDTIKMYEYDYDFEEWELYNTEKLIYNTDNLLIESLGDFEKTTYTYNPQGRQAKIVMQEKVAGAFINEEKYEYLYDTILSDYKIENTEYYWKNGNWVQSVQCKNIIEWNASKNADSETEIITSEGNPSDVSKIEVEYGADQRASTFTFFVQDPETTQWREVLSLTNMLWHKWEGNFINDFYQKNQLASARFNPDENGELNAVYTDSGFVVNIKYDINKEVITFKDLDTRGSYEESISYYTLLDSEYVLEDGKKIREIKDEYSNLISSESFNYDKAAKAWLLEDGEYTPCVYDAFGRIIKMTIISYNDFLDQDFLDTAEYWEYFYNGELTIEKEQSATAHWSVYPNPGKDYFQLQGSQSISELSIYTISGQQVRRLQNVAPAQKIDISNLPKGVYVISAKGEKAVETMRWIKM